MLYYLFSCMVILIDTWCCLYFLDTFLRKKDAGRWNHVRFLLFYIALFLPSWTFYLLGITFNWYKVLMVLAMVFPLEVLYYQASKKQLLFFWILFYSTAILTEWVPISVRGWLFGELYTDTGEPEYLFAVMIKLLEIVVMLLVRRVWKSPNEFQVIKRWEWWMLAVLPMFCLGGILLMYVFYPENVQTRQVYLVLTFGLVGVVFITLCLFQNILHKSEQLQISTVANQSAKNQIAAYREMDALYERQRRRIHDYKNQLITVQSLLQNGNIIEAREFVEKLTQSISVDMSAINTNHPVVNAILNQKFQTAKEKRIAMLFSFGDMHGIRLSEEEIVVLLGNLLDNAIAECERIVRQGGEAVIRLKLVYEEERLVLSVKNPVVQKVEIENNEVRKPHLKEHGIGLKNVEAVVERYDGSFALECTDKEFQAVVIL